MVIMMFENIIFQMNAALRRFANDHVAGNRKLRFIGHIETMEGLINQLQNSNLRGNNFDKWQFSGSYKDYMDYIEYFRYLGDMYMSDEAEKELMPIIKKYENLLKKANCHTKMEV